MASSGSIISTKLEVYSNFTLSLLILPFSNFSSALPGKVPGKRRKYRWFPSNVHPMFSACPTIPFMISCHNSFSSSIQWVRILLRSEELSLNYALEQQRIRRHSVLILHDSEVYREVIHWKVRLPAQRYLQDHQRFPPSSTLCTCCTPWCTVHTVHTLCTLCQANRPRA
jgi:hypothetical protein